jgi:pilus assembly protein CpaF
MAFLDRIFGQSKGTPDDKPDALQEVEPQPSASSSGDYQDIKSRVHNRLFDFIDFSKLGGVTEDRIAADIATLARRILAEEKVPFTHEERERIIEEVQHEVFGLGPLEPLLKDPTISDILVNGPHSVYVERFGKLERAIAQFKDSEHLMRILEKILAAVGRRIDELTPFADARLEDGSRVHAIIPPLALDGPIISVRRFATDPLTHHDLVELGTLTSDCAMILQGIVRTRLNIVISGGTGSGKTTLLNVLSGFIPDTERIITVEDSAELQLKQDHIVRLETRPPNVENRGKVSQRDLVINSLRMRPDRIIVGEVRGEEALDMLQAMNTGHDGSLTTIHANSAHDAMSRIETMVAMSGLDIPQRAVQHQICSAIDIVIQLSRFSDGTRRLLSLMEVTGLGDGVVEMNEIFHFDNRGTDENGAILGELVATGVVPRFLDKLKLAGVEFPEHLFKGSEESKLLE